MHLHGEGNRRGLGTEHDFAGTNALNHAKLDVADLRSRDFKRIVGKLHVANLSALFDRERIEHPLKIIEIAEPFEKRVGAFAHGSQRAFICCHLSVIYGLLKARSWQSEHHSIPASRRGAQLAGSLRHCWSVAISLSAIKPVERATSSRAS